MKKFQKILLFLVLAVFLWAGSAWATPFNNNRPWSGILSTPSTETNLQTIFNNTFNPDALNSVSNQSNAAVWITDEAAVDSYLITMIKGDDGNLGIYSYDFGYEIDLSLGASNSVSFSINDDNDLYVGGDLAQSSFGKSFGFYWENTSFNLTSYTEDSKNGSYGYGPDEDILALTYLVPDGTQAYLSNYQDGTTVTLYNNNDWVLAFEDRPKGDTWGDYDFNDAVFLVEDMKPAPVPEPATMLLLGSGLIGLAGIGRRKFFGRPR